MRVSDEWGSMTCSPFELFKQFSIILIAFGISTMIFGAIFGSYFGDFFQKLGFNVPLLVDSMTDVIITLSVAIGVGAFHMGIGLFCGLLENLRLGEI